MSQLRLLVTVCRSGGTAFLQTLAQSLRCECWAQPIKRGFQEAGRPYYDFFEAQPNVAGNVIVAKETFGFSNKTECQWRLFPEGREDLVTSSRPIFLFRDPLHVANSWHRLGWQLPLFLLAYQTALRTFWETRTVSAHVILYDALSWFPREGFQWVCNHWDIPFTETMREWEHPATGNDQRVNRGVRSQKNFDTAVHAEVRQSRSFRAVERNISLPNEFTSSNEFLLLQEEYSRLKNVSAKFEPLA